MLHFKHMLIICLTLTEKLKTKLQGLFDDLFI